jgi:hypothetical protein
MCKRAFGSVSEASLHANEREAGMPNWLLDRDIVVSRPYTLHGGI